LLLKEIKFGGLYGTKLELIAYQGHKQCAEFLIYNYFMINKGIFDYSDKKFLYLLFVLCMVFQFYFFNVPPNTFDLLNQDDILLAPFNLKFVLTIFSPLIFLIITKRRYILILIRDALKRNVLDALGFIFLYFAVRQIGSSIFELLRQTLLLKMNYSSFYSMAIVILFDLLYWLVVSRFKHPNTYIKRFIIFQALELIFIVYFVMYIFDLKFYFPVIP